MKASVSRITAVLLVAVILALTLASCGTTVYKKQGITFELPSSFEQRAIENALYAYGDDESYLVFNKHTKSALATQGITTLDVAEFVEHALDKNGMTDAVEVEYGVDRAEFSYVAADSDAENVLYYCYSLVIKGSDCIWMIQMFCYATLSSDYIPEFEKWAASIVLE